jgi:phage tail tube protein FII
MNQIGESIKNGADAVIGAVQDFGQSVDNWLSSGVFGHKETAADLGMTEEDYREWKQYQKEQAALGIDVQYSKTKIQLDESEKKGSDALHTIEDFEDKYIKNGEINTKAFFKDYENIKEFNKYLDAKLDIKKMDDSLIDITNEDAINLSKTLRQSENGALSLQLQKEYGMSKAKANEAARTSCKSATSYWMLKLNGATKSNGENIGSYSEFLKENIKDGNIKNEKGWVFDSLISKYGFETVQTKDYDDYITSSNGRWGETRIHVNAKDYDHSIPTYSDGGTRRIADVGSRNYGGLVEEKIFKKGNDGSKKEYFKYFQYLQKKRGQR